MPEEKKELDLVNHETGEKVYWINDQIKMGPKNSRAHAFNGASGAGPENRIQTVPQVVETEGNMNRSMDMYSKLLNEKIIYLTGTVDEDMAQDFFAKLRFLENSLQPGDDIEVVINSPGGSVLDGFVIYDMMVNSPLKINTVATGMAASMGAFLLSAGDHRMAQPNTRIMIHQVASGAQGKATDMNISMDETNILKTRLTEYLAYHSGRTFKEMWDNMERDNYMNPYAAKELGLIDEVVGPKKGIELGHKRWLDGHQKIAEQDRIYKPETPFFTGTPEEITDPSALDQPGAQQLPANDRGTKRKDRKMAPK